MVIIPNPGKDHTSIKGLRPIVLRNTNSKLGEKVITDRLQKAREGFHELQYGTRKGRSAITNRQPHPKGIPEGGQDLSSRERHRLSFQPRKTPTHAGQDSVLQSGQLRFR